MASLFIITSYECKMISIQISIKKMKEHLKTKNKNKMLLVIFKNYRFTVYK